MPVKIRLQRRGKKGKPFFHIAVVDSRAKRDGRCIERLGNYNPNTEPATIHLHVDKAVDWLQKGAQPTDTARAILSYKGALYKKHLLGGVKKGAFDESEAERRFESWLTEKTGKIADKAEGIAKANEEKEIATKSKTAEKSTSAGKEESIAKSKTAEKSTGTEKGVK